jgi:hypothetical protein
LFIINSVFIAAATLITVGFFSCFDMDNTLLRESFIHTAQRKNLILKASW